MLAEGVREALAEPVDDFDAVEVPVAVPLPALRPLAVGAASVAVGAPAVADVRSVAVVEGERETAGEREEDTLPRAEGEEDGQ